MHMMCYCLNKIFINSQNYSWPSIIKQQFHWLFENVLHILTASNVQRPQSSCWSIKNEHFLLWCETVDMSSKNWQILMHVLGLILWGIFFLEICFQSAAWTQIWFATKDFSRCTLKIMCSMGPKIAGSFKVIRTVL